MGVGGYCSCRTAFHVTVFLTGFSPQIAVLLVAAQIKANGSPTRTSPFLPHRRDSSAAAGLSTQMLRVHGSILSLIFMRATSEPLKTNIC